MALTIFDFDENPEPLSKYQRERRQQTIKLVDDLTNFVNTMSMDQTDFNRYMASQHRTLQQSFTRLCLGWLAHVAKDEYRTDDRNEDSKKTAQMISKLVEEKTGYQLGPNFLGFI